MKEEHLQSLVSYRLEQANESLMDADALIEAKRTPRSIVNRCYYAMFYAATAALQAKGMVSTKHSGVLSLFDTEFVLKGIFSKELSRDFHWAFDLRQKSDYGVSPAVDLPAALEVLASARTFVDAVGNFLRKQD